MSPFNWLTLGLGGLLLVVGVRSLVRHFSYRRRSVTVPAVVVELPWNYSRGSRRYYPVFEFRTREGAHVRAASQLGSNPAPAQVGEEVSIGYDPHDPQQAELVQRGGTSLVLLLIAPILGVVLLGSGLGALLAS